MLLSADERLSEIDVEFSNGSACCVVMASNGYPKAYESGYEIKVADDFEGQLFVAGAKADNGKMLTAGGRVLGVTETADTLEEAIKKAYKQVEKVSFDNAFYRKDIGSRALKAKEGK